MKIDSGQLRGVLTVVGLMAVLSGCVSSGDRVTSAALRDMADKYPSPDLAPSEVVAIQLNALKYNDKSDRGIEIVFRFTSESIRTATGPLARFIVMINEEEYRPLLNHKNADFYPIVMRGNRAFQRIVLRNTVSAYLYLFSLSRQSNENCRDCWMTDAVILESVQHVPPIVQQEVAGL